MPTYPTVRSSFPRSCSARTMKVTPGKPFTLNFELGSVAGLKQVRADRRRPHRRHPHFQRRTAASPRGLHAHAASTRAGTRSWSRIRPGARPIPIRSGSPCGKCPRCGAALVPVAATPRSLRAGQIRTMVLLFAGYAACYYCRADLSVATPLLVEELGKHGISHGEALVRIGAHHLAGRVRLRARQVLPHRARGLLGRTAQLSHRRRRRRACSPCCSAWRAACRCSRSPGSATA